MPDHPPSRPRPALTRRRLLGLSTTALLLAACRKTGPELALPPAPTASEPVAAEPTRAQASTATATATTARPEATATPAPTETLPSTSAPPATAQPTDAPVPSSPTPPLPSRADVVRGYPEAPSRVVSVHRPGAVGADLMPISQEVVGHMLDAAMRQLTGLADALQPWKLLFDTDERVAIKVNAIAGSRFHTHVQVVLAVAQRLMDAGLPAEQIVIFDRSSSELERAGYTINRDGPGIRCYGSDGSYTAGWSMMDTPVAVSSILLECDALINIPVLKQHSIAGISYVLKNHYGTFDKPGSFHGQRVVQGLAELNALEPIRARTRLIIGDALTVCTRNWNAAVPGDRLLAGFDPIALDTAALGLYTELARADGANPASAQAVASRWLDAGHRLGLGAQAAGDIELIEEALT